MQRCAACRGAGISGVCNVAIGWLTALKIVPWGEVIEAAPALVSSARKFLNRSQQPPVEAAPAGAVLERESPLAQLQSRVDRLEAGVVRLGEQQQSSAALIENLAEQNAQLVAAVDRLRKRLGAALGGLGVLALALGGLAWSSWLSQ